MKKLICLILILFAISIFAQNEEEDIFIQGKREYQNAYSSFAEDSPSITNIEGNLNTLADIIDNQLSTPDFLFGLKYYKAYVMLFSQYAKKETDLSKTRDEFNLAINQNF